MDAEAFPLLIQGLLRPDAYPQSAEDGAGPVEHIETHISHVFLVGDRAFKLMKPLDLGFLDFSTLERRRQGCEEELRLNRRLAPSLYLGVVPITGTPDRPRVGGTGPALEYAVQMQRFPQEALLDRCPLPPGLVDRLAARVATFHAEVPRADPASPFGTPNAVLAPMLENLSQIRDQIRDRVADLEFADRLDQLEAWTLERWRALIPVIERRRREGRIRECHGDMHRGNIALVNGEPLFFDALEFNPNLRWIDTASELAFLIMDLQEAGEPGQAGRLLNRYLELGGDYGALEVLTLYQVYRAMVRAKVLAIRLGQTDLATAEAAEQRLNCTRYLELAASYTRRRRPRLLLTCGLSGSGKSRLACCLREALPAIHLRSDLERKRLFGLGPEERPRCEISTGIYSPQATERTYQRLLALADSILGCGYNVVVDATFLSRAWRSAFRDLARHREIGFVALTLLAPMAVLRERVARRAAAGGDASDATLPVLESQARVCNRLSRSERRLAILINSTDPPPLQTLLERIADLTGVPLGE